MAISLTKLMLLLLWSSHEVWFSECKIFHTRQFEKKKSIPQHVDLFSDSDKISSSMASINLRLRRFVQDKQPQTPSLPGINEMKSSMFDLENGTKHNQALIHYSGKDSKVIFILTRKKETSTISRISDSSLWRSTDYGVTYSSENSKFEAGTILKSFFICPNDKKKMIFIDNFNNFRRVWVSKDEGETYEQHNLPDEFSIGKIEFHPNIDDTLLGYDPIRSKLWVSQDLGSTWKLLHSDVTKDRYYWYVDGVDQDVHTVHFEYRHMGFLPQRVYLAKSCRIPDCQPTQFNVFYEVLGRIDKESLNVQDKYVFVQKPGALQKLYVSYDRNNFVKSMFSGSELSEQTDFHIVSSDYGTVVAGVSHDDTSTHLFTSDLKGEKFTLSMSRVRYFPRKVGDDEYAVSVDIYEVKGVRGSYIMNVIDENFNNVTMITWNNGRGWSYLNPPTDAADHISIPCNNCHLNLHILLSQTTKGYYAPVIMSKNSTPGLIVAHGSISTTLSELPTRLNIYVSQDAGVTWKKVLEKRHLIHFADHGAMLVGVQMIFLQPVNQLKFSNDFGSTWSTHVFSREKINVDGLLTEPGEYTQHFTLFGHRHYRDNWKLFALDFSPLVSRNCSYPDDYYNVTLPIPPSNQHQIPSNCNLGMRQIFELLHPNAKCMIGREYKRITQREECPCADNDYECDFGFSPNISGSCVVYRRPGAAIDDISAVLDDLHITLPLTSITAACVNGTRLVSTGFRRIPGDVCTPELEGKVRRSEECVDGATTSPSPQSNDVELVLLNRTNEAKMGEELHFVVDNPDVSWTIVRAVGGEQVKPHQISTETIGVSPSQPGAYEVRASLPSSPSISDTILVSFWYPIEQVFIHLPPVVEVNTAYNATATLRIKDGLRGTQSLVGEVSYTWYTGTLSAPLNRGGPNVISVRHSNVREYHLQVTANNRVSGKSAFGKVVVKKYVEKLILVLKSSSNISDAMMTHEWLNELHYLLLDKILSLDAVMMMVDLLKMEHNNNFHIYIPPRLPLIAELIFSPGISDQPPKDQLLKTAVTLETFIASSDMKVLLSGQGSATADPMIISVQDAYVINDAGEMMRLGAGGMNSGIVVLVCIIIVLVVCLAVFVFRKYARDFRWNSYFHMRSGGHARSSSIVGRSHIVRSSHNDDRDPIVDDDDFMDEELDTMETIGHPGQAGGTLEFQS